MGSLKLIKKNKFGNISCDVYEKNGEYFVTREQIGRALGYKYPKEAIKSIHRNHKERLDNFSRGVVIDTPLGGKQETILYSSKGIYEICRWSNQPKANGFYDFIYELLENIRTEKIKLKFEKKTPEWKQIRIEAKTSTKSLHNDIHDKFIPYAVEKGSKTYANKPTLAYTHFDKHINEALGITKNNREQLDTLKQNLLDIMNKSCSCIIDIEINKDTDYHDIISVSKDKINKISDIFTS